MCLPGCRNVCGSLQKRGWQRETCTGPKNVLWETAQSFTDFGLVGRHLRLRGCPGLKEHLKDLNWGKGGKQRRQTGHERSAGGWEWKEGLLHWEDWDSNFLSLYWKLSNCCWFGLKVMHNGSAPYVIKQPPDYQSVSRLHNQHNYQMINYYTPLPSLMWVWGLLHNSGRSTTELTACNVDSHCEF